MRRAAARSAAPSASVAITVRVVEDEGRDTGREALAGIATRGPELVFLDARFASALAHGRRRVKARRAGSSAATAIDRSRLVNTRRLKQVKQLQKGEDAVVLTDETVIDTGRACRAAIERFLAGKGCGARERSRRWASPILDACVTVRLSRPTPRGRGIPASASVDRSGAGASLCEQRATGERAANWRWRWAHEVTSPVTLSEQFGSVIVGRRQNSTGGTHDSASLV